MRDERLSIYFTDNLEEGTVHLDEDEFVEVIKVPIDNVKSMLMNKEIEDAEDYHCITCIIKL